MAWRLDHLQDLLLIGAALIHCHYINQSEFIIVLCQPIRSEYLPILSPGPSSRSLRLQ